MGNSIKKVKYEAQYHYYNQKLKRKKRQYKKKYKTSYKSKSIKKKYVLKKRRLLCQSLLH